MRALPGLYGLVAALLLQHPDPLLALSPILWGAALLVSVVFSLLSLLFSFSPESRQASWFAQML